MKKELMELVENYVNWIGVQFEDNVDFVGDDYIDSIEDMFEEAKIPYIEDEISQVMEKIIQLLKQKYGEDNIHYGAPEHTISHNDQLKTIYNQLVITK
ncbi:hypothetical protein CN491_24345 [Bacillus cereus]|uniref:Uncharacterized protein n=1 Tax=Bacillus cereus TaxID=1396 RepID=A0A2A8LI14_BACCE|nr:hypothetical protein [Bacillus cereus]PES90482.1 hypothetical protein CN491_24345 [Bacillus cereus]